MVYVLRHVRHPGGTFRNLLAIAMTRIDTLIARGRTISLEFFPPKTPEMEQQLRDALADLAALSPSFVSVTYGALGSTRDRTRDLVAEISTTHDLPVMAHLTCVGHTRAEIQSILEQYRAAGIENILALAGDPPADAPPPEGDFSYAIELVDLVRSLDGFSIGVAAHPELHPRSRGDRARDREHLAAKLDRADFAITQFFFDVDDYVRMIDELAALGCTKPVLPGVMPILNVAGARRMAAMNSAAIPDALNARLDAADGDPDAVRAVGIEVATEICERLIRAGAPGLHLYTLNRAQAVTEILRNLGLA